MSKLRVHFGNGFLIGAGMAAAALGFLGWFTANYITGQLIPLFHSSGIPVDGNHILVGLDDFGFRSILVLGVGVFSLLVGGINEYLRKREATESDLKQKST